MKLLTPPEKGHAANRTSLENQKIVDALKKMRIATGSQNDESFLVEKSWAIYGLAKRHGMEVLTRKENGTGVRVWRVG